jgi:hypothetical protein
MMPLRQSISVFGTNEYGTPVCVSRDLKLDHDPAIGLSLDAVVVAINNVQAKVGAAPKHLSHFVVVRSGHGRVREDNVEIIGKNAVRSDASRSGEDRRRRFVYWVLGRHRRSAAAADGLDGC